MNEDDKAIYVASQQFNDVLARLDAVLIYQATDRHGLFEWAAKVELDNGWDSYVSLGIWEVEPHKILGVQGSAAQVRGQDKYVCDFTEQVSIEHEDYHLLETSIQNVLKQAVEAGKKDLSNNPDLKLPELYAFASPPAMEA
jgi:hypothetical protein